jgi:hypothetical protein
MSGSPSSLNTEQPHRHEAPAIPDRPGTAPAMTGSAEGQRHSAESRDIAQARLLLYLKSLNVPPGKEQLTLALDALTRLGADGGAHDITPAAMQSIRGLLKTSGLPIESADESKLYSMGGFTRGLEGLQSMPALHRGHMLPVKFDQLPEWMSTESFLTTAITQLRPLLIPLLILFNILLLIGLFFWL